jgi:aldehyde:ferredoxin oxidoreductase
LYKLCTQLTDLHWDDSIGRNHAVTETPLMKKYHDLGTTMNILPLNLIGGLPTCNLQSDTFERAENNSEEWLAADYLGRRVACAHCLTACII